MERRRGRRRRVRVRVRAEPGAVTTVSGDIGGGGIFVYSARVHEPGTPVRLSVHLPEGEAEALGVVRWAKRVPPALLAHTKGGMGIEFTWVSPALQEFLCPSQPVAAAAG